MKKAKASVGRLFVLAHCREDVWVREKDLRRMATQADVPWNAVRSALAWFCDRRMYVEGYFWRLHDVDHSKVEIVDRAEWV